MTIGIERVNDYPLIRLEIRFERKFLICRSLVTSNNHLHSNTAELRQSAAVGRASANEWEKQSIFVLFVCLLGV